MTDASAKPASVLILGSGPVVIGQAAEFDYAGTQACRALRAEGVRTILVNSNPATIMTDPQVADAIYLEPLTVDAVEAVIAKERPDGILAGLGGQTALNLAMALADAGVFERYDVRLLGTPLEAIRMAEDREAFRDLLDRIDQPYAPSWIVEKAEDVDIALREIGLPAIVRPAFTLGGTGGGIVPTEAAYRERVRAGLRASPIGQVMVEKCLVGWQEIEYEVMRDADDTCIAVCSMENVDPLGVHTGDSIVVAPVQTLTDAVHQRLRSAALAIIRALGVEGGCNVQFALSPDSTEYAVIEVNPRVSRSSALASKATGYPIARVAAQIAVGRRLAEIPNVVTGTTVAAFEPALDYVVVKLPRFPFDKFPTADRTLGSQMKATGEVMAIDRTFGSALNKALRGLEQAGAGPLAEDPSWTPTFDYLAGVYAGDPDEDEPIRWIDESGQACESTRFAQRSGAPIVLRRFLGPSDSRLWRLLGLLRRGVPEAVVGEATGISPWFLAEMGRNVALEREVTVAGERLADPTDDEAAELLATVKRAGFGDKELAGLAGTTADAIREARLARGIVPGYAMVDTCAAEFAAETPYFYSTYAAAGSTPEAGPVERPAALVIGSGPVRIGQGIEFDYCAVQAADTLRQNGWQAVMINSNPETVSTDFDASSRLYFEPLDPESVRSVIDAEGGIPAVVAYGGQTPLNLAATARGRWRGAARVRPRGDRPGGGARPVRRPARPARHPPAGRRHGPQRRRGTDAGGAHRLSGHRPAVVRDRWARDRFLLFARGPRAPAGAGDGGRSRPARPHRPLSRGHRGRCRCRERRRARADPRVARACRACRRPLRGQRGDVPAADGQRGRPGPHRGDDGADRAGPRRARAGERAVHRARRRRLPDRGQPARIADRAVHVQGDRRADGRARGADLAGCHARRAGLGRWAAAATAVRRREGAGLLDRQAAWRRPVGRAGYAVDRRGHRDPRSIREWPLRRRSSGRRWYRRDRVRLARLALLSIADRDKDLLARLAAGLAGAGYRLAATPGTRRRLADVGYDARPVAKLGEVPDTSIGEVPILDLIASGEVRLVVNTPTPRSGAVRDAAEIRHAATAEGILCLTAMETAVAAAEALDPSVAEAVATVRSLDEWVPEPGQPAQPRLVATA